MAALLVLLVTSVACLNSPAPRAEPVPVGPSAVSHGDTQTVEVPIGTSVRVPGSGATVTFVRVTEDSRCPTGTTCIWEGDAVAELRVTAAGVADETLQLHTNRRFAYQSRAAGATLTLERLDPYPTANGAVPPDAYLLSLKISSN